jgi:hypothetical protein
LITILPWSDGGGVEACCLSEQAEKNAATKLATTTIMLDRRRFNLSGAKAFIDIVHYLGGVICFDDESSVIRFKQPPDKRWQGLQ